MIVAGVDPSLTGIGLVAGSGDSNFSVTSFGHDKISNTVQSRIRRYEWLSASVVEWFGESRPQCIFIEGYAFTSHKGVVQAEFGGILRWHLTDFTTKIIEVSPGTLKKFAADNGRASKDDIRRAMSKRYGITLSNSDEYDAYALWRMALIHVGIDKAHTIKQSEALQTAVSYYEKESI